LVIIKVGPDQTNTNQILTILSVSQIITGGEPFFLLRRREPCSASAAAS
jgi:hypothetical protein